MNLQFQYDLQKDIRNYQIASQSKNNKQPTKMQALYVAEYGETFEDKKLATFITRYIAEQKLDISREIEKINNAWRSIEQECLKKIESIFGIICPLDIVRVFLTTDTRCSYNIEQGYFFVSVSKSFPNKTILHELLHFWTWWVFREKVTSGRMTKGCYNDVKESLTELLNVEFQDVLDGAHDDGYPQHQEMRAIVHKTWVETRDIKKVFTAASKLCPLVIRDA